MIPYTDFKSTPDQAWYRASIAELRQRFPEDAPGFFGPESITWKIYREPGILLGSYRALLLQVAHPAVGAGVKQYSDFQKDYLGRAHRTFSNMASIFFGSCTLAQKTAEQLHRMHYHIRGEYTRTSGQTRFYCANEPALLAWILATLTDTSIVAYELLHPPLTLEEKEQFIRESQITAQLMGIPAGYYPESYDNFYAYYQQMIDGAELEVGATARGLAVDILRGPFHIGRSLIRLFATALLPDRLIAAYDLPWSPKLARRFQHRLAMIRRIYLLCPAALRYAPPYHQAMYRMAAARRKKSNFLPILFHWLGDHFKTPFLIAND